MAPDLRLAVVDGAAVVLLVVLALTTGWWWWFPTAGWGFVALRQARLARRSGDSEGSD